MPGAILGLIDAQRCVREEAAKKKKVRKEREEMKTEVNAAKAALQSATATLDSV